MQYLRHDPRNYPKPTDKALASAQNLKDQQRYTAERYEEVMCSPAPAWMRASAEEIARHIDMVHYFATIHGVQVKWSHVEYGLSDEEIEAIAIAKKSYKYTIGDYMPFETPTVKQRGSWNDHLAIRNYHGVWYITINSCVTGVYIDRDGIPRITSNSLTNENIISVRYETQQDAEAAFGQIRLR